MQESSSKRRRIVIVGGGISGLAAAHHFFELQSQDTSFAAGARPEVLLLEASAGLGGTVRTHRREGFLLEGGPDSFISEKPAALELARRLGLAERLIETNGRHRRSFVVRNGRLRPTPEGFQLLAPSRMLPFLSTDIFTWRGKARMALDLLLPRRKDANGQTDESLAAFVRRRFGREALERMAQPMVGGIYTADPESLSLRATMPRFLEMERRHRSLILAMWKNARQSESNARHGRGASGARYSLFLSFDEGTQVLTDALAARLPADSVRLNTRVESIELELPKLDSNGQSSELDDKRQSSGLDNKRHSSELEDTRQSSRLEDKPRRWLLKTDGGETISADAVCLALPAYAAARLLRETDDALASELDAIPYASTATVNLAYRRADIPHPLDGFGFVVPFIERRPTLACTFSSVKFEGRAPEGHALLRAFVGGALQPEMFDLDEERMTEAVRRDLRDLLGIERPPLFAHVEKWPRSMAQYHLGHLERLSRINARLQNLPTLALCGNAYTGAGLPDCIRSGEAAADSLFTEREGLRAACA
ncbi:MAG TPA: protoporphyrinogen oxidase [Pyrinomonadaceae bacterium]|jgi:oxygen-dependent protoporphyrinogen oxidase|nr:protoporphyrinogen oxidase [Pyrinomonadaceae bacterium]